MVTKLQWVLAVKLAVLLSHPCLAAEPPSLETPAGESLRVKDLVITLVDRVEIPAAQTGVLSRLEVREGERVRQGDLVGSLDNRQAKLELSLAETQLNVVKFRGAEDRSVELASKQLESERLLAKRHAIELEMAESKAENKVRIEASEKSEAVALNELERALRARQEYVDSVSKSEIDSLRLQHERTKLETKQASFERQLDELAAKAETQVASGHAANIERRQIEVAQTAATKLVAEMEIQLQEHQAALASLVVAQHELRSPLDGVVVELFHQPGDWVTAGESIARVVRLDRLRAEGFVSIDSLAKLRDTGCVELTIAIGGNKFVQRLGEIVFVSPEVNPVNREVAFWVEFDNPDGDVLPGMRLDMEAISAPDSGPADDNSDDDDSADHKL